MHNSDYVDKTNDGFFSKDIHEDVISYNHAQDNLSLSIEQDIRDTIKTLNDLQLSKDHEYEYSDDNEYNLKILEECCVSPAGENRKITESDRNQYQRLYADYQFYLGLNHFDRKDYSLRVTPGHRNDIMEINFNIEFDGVSMMIYSLCDIIDFLNSNPYGMRMPLEIEYDLKSAYYYIFCDRCGNMLEPEYLDHNNTYGLCHECSEQFINEMKSI